MRRRLVLAALAIVGGVMSTHAAEQPPNIVLIISDDQGWTDYGFMGHQLIKTPHLDQLAKQSVVFRRGYVPTALCRPSLTTLITGRYAHQSLVTGNDPANTPENQQHVRVSGRRFKNCSFPTSIEFPRSLEFCPNRAISAFKAANGGKEVTSVAASPTE